MRVSTGFVLCLVSGALGAGIDHYWTDLVPLVTPLLQSKSTVAQTATPASDQKKVEVKLGISDGMNVEVVSGLNKGDKVVQRPPKEIS